MQGALNTHSHRVGVISQRGRALHPSEEGLSREDVREEPSLHPSEGRHVTSCKGAEDGTRGVAQGAETVEDGSGVAGGKGGEEEGQVGGGCWKGDVVSQGWPQKCHHYLYPQGFTLSFYVVVWKARDAEKEGEGLEAMRGY